jgi:hypothetical protein
VAEASGVFASNGTRFVAGCSTPISTSSRVYAVPEIEATSISFGGLSAAEIDVTMLASSWKEYVLGTLDLGTIEVSGFVRTATAIPIPSSGSATPQAMSLIFGTDRPKVVGDENGVIRVDAWAYLVGVSVESAVDAAVALTLTYRLTDGISMYARNAQDTAWVRVREIGRTFDDVSPGL